MPVLTRQKLYNYIPIYEFEVYLVSYNFASINFFVGMVEVAGGSEPSKTGVINGNFLHPYYPFISRMQFSFFLSVFPQKPGT